MSFSIAGRLFLPSCPIHVSLQTHFRHELPTMRCLRLVTSLQQSVELRDLSLLTPCFIVLLDLNNNNRHSFAIKPIRYNVTYKVNNQYQRFIILKQTPYAADVILITNMHDRSFT